RSDEALRLDEDRLGSRRAHAFGDCGPGDSVPLAEGDHLFAVELHAAPPPFRVANASSTCCFDTSPESRSSSSPLRIKMYVGSPNTRSSRQTSRFCVESTLTTRTAPPASSSRSLIVGIIARHGWHRGPQKSTKTLPSFVSSLNVSGVASTGIPTPFLVREESTCRRPARSCVRGRASPWRRP